MVFLVRRLAPIALSTLSLLSLVSAQIGTPASDFVHGSPVLISAFATATGPAANNAPNPGAPTGIVFQHFLQIWLENADYSTVQALSQFQTVASKGILLTNYNAITHPSEPNYVAAVAGSNYGITDDSYYDIPANIRSIFDLVEAKGLKWKAYDEQLPYPGWTGKSTSDGLYFRKHNPAIVFDTIGLDQSRSANVVGGDRFLTDVSTNNIPAYGFYTPNMNNDGHDTSASTAGTWLVNFLNTNVFNAPFYQNSLILVVFDENKTSSQRNQVWGCLLGGVIPTNLVGTTDNTYYTHYSALHTVELNWGLGSLNQGDAIATSSNVFSFAASALGYTNTPVPSPPKNNVAITGLLTDCSWDYVSVNGNGNCQVGYIIN